jgi:hypothetical protein
MKVEIFLGCEQEIFLGCKACLLACLPEIFLGYRRAIAFPYWKSSLDLIITRPYAAKTGRLLGRFWSTIGDKQLVKHDEDATDRDGPSLRAD